ncbi:MAG TPA: ABC transporter ATPase, partial [Sphingobacteriaceae bacterium]|nr:ABC transporter ATPase [Sphingobacteriaceae bacterium]
MEISENSRIWIYQANRVLNPVEQEQIQRRLNDFTSQWQAHGHQLTALAEIRYHRFIILMVDEARAGATGCSIDKSVNLMKELEDEFNINLFDRLNIAYRTSEDVTSCTREEFEALIETGKVTEDTIVFNNLVPTIKEL